MSVFKYLFIVIVPLEHYKIPCNTWEQYSGNWKVYYLRNKLDICVEKNCLITDSYDSDLIGKQLYGMKMLHNKSKWIIKVDYDTFIHIPTIENILKKNVDWEVSGLLMKNVTIKSGKYFNGKERRLNTYMDGGIGYIIKSDIIPCVIEMSNTKKRFFNYEDVTFSNWSSYCTHNIKDMNDYLSVSRWGRHITPTRLILDPKSIIHPVLCERSKEIYNIYSDNSSLIKKDVKYSFHNGVKDIYQLYCIKKENDKPFLNLGQGTTGTKAIFATVCATNQPAFHWDTKCNTKQRPNAYKSLTLLVNCTTHKSKNEYCKTIVWAKYFKENILKDLSYDVSLIDTPYSNAPTIMHNFKNKFVNLLSIRHPKEWSKRRYVSHTGSQVCTNSEYSFDHYSCAKKCEFEYVYDCFQLLNETKHDVTKLYQEYNQKQLSDFKPYVTNLFVTKRVNITISCVVHNEGYRIKEWIEYHRIRGVEKFVLYDNGSTKDNLANILSEYIRDEIVYYYPTQFVRSLCLPKLQIKLLHKFNVQGVATVHATANYIMRTNYLIFMDVDEYLDTDSYNFKETLDKYEKFWLKPKKILWNFMTPGSSIWKTNNTYYQHYKSKKEGKIIIKNSNNSITSLKKILRYYNFLFTNIHFAQQKSVEKMKNDVRLFHFWCDDKKKCLGERRSKPYWTSEHEKTLEMRLKFLKISPKFNTNFNEKYIPTLKRNLFNLKKNIYLYGLGRSRTTISYAIFSSHETVLGIFEPCRIYDKLGNYFLFTGEHKESCEQLLVSISKCQIEETDFFALKKNQLRHFKSHSYPKKIKSEIMKDWKTRSSWVKACAQKRKLIKEIRFLPNSFISKNFLTVYIQRNFENVKRSQKRMMIKEKTYNASTFNKTFYYNANLFLNLTPDYVINKRVLNNIYETKEIMRKMFFEDSYYVNQTLSYVNVNINHNWDMFKK